MKVPVMPCGLRGAISGILAGGILGFRIAGFLLVVLHLHRDLAVMFWGFCLLLFARLIHRHTSCSF